MKQLALTAVALFTLAGCRSDDRAAPSAAPPPAPEAAPAPKAIGGGPSGEVWSREATIDRLAHARCHAAERCGAFGTKASTQLGFSECVEVARAELGGSFGAATCDGYDGWKLDACAREQADAACGAESNLSAGCVESSLCK